VPLRRRYPEFLDGGLNGLIVILGLNDTEILVLVTEFHTPTIHFETSGHAIQEEAAVAP
jgi:hypothetical protein